MLCVCIRETWSLLQDLRHSSLMCRPTVFAGNIADLVQGDNWIGCWPGVLSAEWIFVQLAMQLMQGIGTVQSPATHRAL